MMAGMEMAYKGTMMQGKFPGGILLLEMPADLVDVNVHPAKIEVRFARENDIFDLVYHAVKLSLSQPGTGERLFTFDEPKNNEKSKNKESNDIIEENTVKKNNFTGLSAILSGQAAPGTLPHHTAQPANPVVLSIQAMPTGKRQLFKKQKQSFRPEERAKKNRNTAGQRLHRIRRSNRVSACTAQSLKKKLQQKNRMQNSWRRPSGRP